MINLFYIVGENRLYSRQGIYVSVGNSTDKVQCHFDFKSSEWAGLTARDYSYRSASFNITKVVPLTSAGTCIVPWEVVCKPGIILCYLVGNSDTDKIVTDPVKVMLVTSVAKDDYDYSDEPTPSEYTQFVEYILADMEEYLLEHPMDYESLTNHPSIEGIELLGEMNIGSFGFELASVSDIDNMFD